MFRLSQKFQFLNFNYNLFEVSNFTNRLVLKLLSMREKFYFTLLN